MKASVVIPVRLESSRLPNKALKKIENIPLICHVYERCKLANFIDDVFIATDSIHIKNLMENFGAKVIMTSSHHSCGTDRVAEAAQQINSEIIINVQGDEALVFPEHIEVASKMLIDSKDCNVGILVNKFYKKNSPSDIKVVFNKNKEVLYLSRNDIPSFVRSKFTHMYKAYHVVPFRKNFLKKYVSLPSSDLESTEFNEYLRILDNGYKIKVEEVSSSAVSVDTNSDLAFVRRAMKSDSYLKKYLKKYQKNSN